MSAITISVICFTVWVLIGLPGEIAFLVPALMLIPVWFGIRRTITLTDEAPMNGAFRLSKRMLFALSGAVLLLLWLNIMKSVFHTHIITHGDQTSEIIITVLGFILTPIGFLLFGILSDKGHEKTGLFCGMMLFIAGIMIAMLPGDAQAPWLIPLVFADGFGGAYAEFLILAIPIYFIVNAKRPVLVASLGVVSNLVSSALHWYIDDLLPESLMSIGTPLLTSTIVTVALFLVMVYFLFERHREQTLAAALYSFMHSDAPNTPIYEALPEDETQNELSIIEEPQRQVVIDAGLSRVEIEIAMLMIDGISYRDIANKLHMTAANFKQHEKAIRQKLNLMGGIDPIISAVASEYRLTKRETEILRYLRDSKTNDEIAAELYLSEETVKVHVRNLMKKLPVEKRSDVPEWMEMYKIKTEQAG